MLAARGSDDAQKSVQSVPSSSATFGRTNTASDARPPCAVHDMMRRLSVSSTVVGDRLHSVGILRSCFPVSDSRREKDDDFKRVSDSML